MTVSNPYSLPQKEKEQLLLKELNRLTEHHAQHCSEYQRIIHLLYKDQTHFDSVESLPFLPVNLFKMQDLKSIPKEEIFKILVSSGTTSSHPSKIFLDRETAQKQTQALSEIMTSFLGEERLPMLVIDHPNVIKDRHHYSARGAALIGMLYFGREICYALNEQMELQQDVITQWLSKHQQEPFLLFGLTFVIWEYFLKQLKPHQWNLPQGTLIHTGGWKKLTEIQISNDLYKKKVLETTGIKKCHNFYGMVEQVGSIFMECEQGHLHCPTFADVVIRHPTHWDPCKINEQGVVQVLSILPKSYPGHSLLTEDLGKLLGIDDCDCGRKGKYFQIEGRVPKAEIRGCSDTFERRIQP